jgi:hypothetical protein
MICIDRRSLGSIGLSMVQKHRNEGALPRLELFPSAVDWAFDQRGGRQFVGLRLLEAYFYAIGDALDLFDDGVR